MSNQPNSHVADETIAESRNSKLANIENKTKEDVEKNALTLVNVESQSEVETIFNISPENATVQENKTLVSESELLNKDDLGGTIARGLPFTGIVGGATQGIKGPEGFSIGEIFQGKYEIVRLLGIGGMGRVYQARHLELDNMVAIKILNTGLSSDTEATERFKREAKAMAKITHPNAVRILDYGVENGTCFLTMEFLEGESLRERLAKVKRLSLADVINFAQQVCYVLEFMHRKGITHRDLKPDNIFFQKQDDAEVIKVLDFGIAKVHQTATHFDSNLTREGAMIGTPRYMSPEQCQGTTIDNRSDLYSLGVVLYEMLSGKVPFDADNPFAIALKHINIPAPSLLEILPEVNPTVANVISKVLSKLPQERYQSTKEFFQNLCEAASISPSSKIDLLEGSALMSSFPKTIEKSQNLSSIETKQSEDLSKPNGNTLSYKKKEGDTLLLGSEKDKKNISLLQKFLQVKIILPLIIILTIGIGTVRFSGIWPQSTSPKPIPLIPIPINTDQLKNFVLIPGGSFPMGLNPGKDETTLNGKIPDYETPLHTVTLGQYYISKYELTEAEYKEFVDAQKYPAPKSWKNGSFDAGEEKYPVTNIEWEDAKKYCEWLSQKDGIRYRLPTEEEWEYAARGNDQRLFPWSNKWNEDLVNSFKDNQKGSPLPVDSDTSKIKGDKSPFGIYTMGGNVVEWTASLFRPYVGSSYKPKGKDLECRVVRGGSFNSEKFETRTTSRSWYLPNTTRPYIGFRLVAEVPSK